MNRNNLQIYRLSADPDGRTKPRYPVHGVYVTERETIATDGHALIRVERPASSANGASRVILNRADVLNALRLSKGRQIRASKGVRIEPSETGCTLRVYEETSAGDFERGTIATAPLEGEMPDIDVVIPELGVEKVEVALSCDLLIRALKTIRKVAGKNTAIVFRIGEAESPVRLDAINAQTEQRILAVIMPMKPGDSLRYPIFDDRNKEEKTDANTD